MLALMMIPAKEEEEVEKDETAVVAVVFLASLTATSFDDSFSFSAIRRIINHVPLEGTCALFDTIGIIIIVFVVITIIIVTAEHQCK